MLLWPYDDFISVVDFARGSLLVGELSSYILSHETLCCMSVPFLQIMIFTNANTNMMPERWMHKNGIDLGMGEFYRRKSHHTNGHKILVAFHKFSLL